MKVSFAFIFILLLLLPAELNVVRSVLKSPICLIQYPPFLPSFVMHMYSDKMIGKRIGNHKFIKPFDKLSKVPFLGLYTTPVIMLIIL